MATLDRNDGDKFKIEHERIVKSIEGLPLQKKFTFTKEAQAIDNFGFNSTTGRHQLTENEILEFKLLYKQLLASNMLQHQGYLKMLQAKW
jgi:hypothetical protein